MRARPHNDRGFTSVEAALIVPVALGMILLIVQVMFAVYQNRNIQLAAEEAADAAARYQASNADGLAAADDVLSQLGVAGAQVDATRDGANVEVSITAPVVKIFPIDLTTTATASAPIEEFIELGDRS